MYLIKYFIKSPRVGERNTAIAIIAAGCLACFLAILMLALNYRLVTDAKPPAALIAVVLFGVGIRYVVKGVRRSIVYSAKYHAAEPKPPDDVLDQCLSSDLENLRKRAWVHLDLQSESVRNGPVCMVGPALPAYGSLGSDGVERYSRYEVVIMYVTDFHICAYTCHFDFIWGRPLAEHTQEFTIDDVVSVETISLPMKTAVRVQKLVLDESTLDGEAIWRLGEDDQTPIHIFQVGAASGEHIQANISFRTATNAVVYEAQRMDLRELVRAIRGVLRERKGGTAE
jgi:hypothetical protein